MLAFQRQSIAAALALTLLPLAIPAPADDDAVSRGEYLVRAGGCFSCLTAAGGQQPAGGRALATPFGTFYSPNITPDRETGGVICSNWADKLIQSTRTQKPTSNALEIIITRGNFIHRKKLNARPASQDSSPLFGSAASCIY
jgi:hypothetical protein